MFNKKKIKIDEIYVSITVCILQLIYISWGRKNSQNSMLDNTEYNHISTDKYYQEILQEFMLALYVYVTLSLTLAYLDAIDNI